MLTSCTIKVYLKRLQAKESTMLNVTITLSDEDHTIIKTRQVNIISGVEQLKDLMFDSLNRWIPSKDVKKTETFLTYEGNPVMEVYLHEDDEVYYLFGNLNKIEKR